jgi:cyclic beta-1,2-glucan synthetase
VRSELRKIARRTWRYFDNFVVPGQHYLPPDNVQQTPNAVVPMPDVADQYRRLSAVDHFGAGFRLDQSFDEAMQVASSRRSRHVRSGSRNIVAICTTGIDTRTLDSLHPRYVSSVDSGNLAGHLIAVASACRDLGARCSRARFTAADRRYCAMSSAFSSKVLARACG